MSNSNTLIIARTSGLPARETPTLDAAHHLSKSTPCHSFYSLVKEEYKFNIKDRNIKT